MFIIPAAGKGNRLGLNVPKALVKIQDKYLIEWQLDELYGKEVIIVAGYMAGELKEAIGDRATVVVNNNYETTNTLDSVCRGLDNIEDDQDVTILDGDILFKWGDYLEKGHFVAVKDFINDDPVYACVRNEEVVSFGRDIAMEFEWACICRGKAKWFRQSGNEYIFEALVPHLPLPAVQVDVAEIDIFEDIKRAEEWIKQQEIKSKTSG
jgi:CTP:phosphocholine cytidylyltransferase-like protein